ncbi:MAG: hypothetical protein H0V80_10535 [Acidobacteria bacterium]|nr:hypothetical protein [Acidobacteriota bacterium]
MVDDNRPAERLILVKEFSARFALDGVQEFLRRGRVLPTGSDECGPVARPLDYSFVHMAADVSDDLRLNELTPCAGE